MVIDFHTHIFPDAIAAKTIRQLEKAGNNKAYTDGTLAGLKSSMKDNNIDISIVLPVVTRPSQFRNINNFASEINGKDGIISFGGIHPDTDSYRTELEEIKRLGLPGIKLHPDYQQTFVDDPKMLRIISYATELGLIVVLHAGIDIGLPDPVHCPPERIINLLSQLEDSDNSAKIILAHTGGFGQWDGVEELIVGRNVWLDISYSLGKIEDEQLKRIVYNHGADRMLFATDSPWDGQGEVLEYFNGLGFEDEEADRILYINAMELLGLK